MFQARLTSLPPRLLDALQSAGATSPGVVSRFVGPQEDVGVVLKEVYRHAKLDQEPSADELDAFVSLQALAKIESVRLRRGALLGYPWQQEANTMRKRSLEHIESQEAAFRWRGPSASGVGSTGLRLAPPISSTHRTSVGRLRGIRDLTSRSEAEEALRAKFVSELVDELIDVGAPSAALAGQVAEPRAVLALLAAGRRAQTLRARLRAWRAFKRWLQAAHGCSWPASWVLVLEYLRLRAAEPCGRSTLLGIIGGITFMERAGGFAGDAAFTQNPLLKEACRELWVRLLARAGDRGVQVAPPILVCMLRRLESPVVDYSCARWLRAYAWWKLLQAWAAMRFDDHGGLDPHSIKITPEGLEFDLHRTKTTGVGKKIERRPSGVSSQAYVAEKNWIHVGLSLWNEIAPNPRDYLLVTPSADLVNTYPKALKYGEAAGWSRAIFRQVLQGAGDSSTVDAVCALFTEHSGRSFVVSAAMAMGASEDFLLPVGGWGATAARTYMRTARRRLLHTQAQVGRAVRSQLDGADEFGERETLDLLVERLSASGYAREHIQEIRDNLTSFPEAACGRPIWKDVNDTDDDKEENVKKARGPLRGQSGSARVSPPRWCRSRREAAHRTRGRRAPRPRRRGPPWSERRRLCSCASTNPYQSRSRASSVLLGSLRTLRDTSFPSPARTASDVYTCWAGATGCPG